VVASPAAALRAAVAASAAASADFFDVSFAPCSHALSQGLADIARHVT